MKIGTMLTAKSKNNQSGNNMKTQLKLFTISWLLTAICFSTHAQGSLTPPGAPAPVMKSLDQIEARTAITNSGAVTISTSGTYYLTTNVTVSNGDAITIAANNVTLDLNGFTISSTRPVATTDTAILFTLAGRMDIAIYNGHISSGVTNSSTGVFSGGGFGYGIYATYAPYNVRVKDVSVLGVLHYGIALGTGGGSSTVVESCTVTVAGNDGIGAGIVSDSTAVNCGTSGINADTAHNCKGTVVGNGYGMLATTANNCYGYSFGSGYGLYVYGAATGCYGYSSSGTGLYAFIASVCHGSTSSGTALSTPHNVNSF
jgi:hypothetical protein